MRTAPRLAGDEHLVLRQLEHAERSTTEVVEALRVDGGARMSYGQACRTLRLLQTRGFLWGWREPDGSKHWTATDAGRAALWH
jgi:DNA-binding PadR family transcriptional regulator